MEDLAKADAKTVRTFIDNNITAERLLVDVLQPKQELLKKQAKGALAQKENLNLNTGVIFDYSRTIDD